ncbi:ABC transporter ATP-binding protein [Dehalococcoidia bacterium]|nr:ABC transporter ATP-binding protein [Dehalococcoidia bacterium]
MLKLENVTLGYDRRTVLSDINLEVAPGELLGIIGPNGSGKSTLIKGICHLLTPKNGRVFIDGRDAASMGRSELASLVAVVPQTATLPEAFTGFEIVLMGRTPHLGLLRYESRSDFDIAWQAMEITKTQPFAERRVGELSSGERQRLTIARALTQEPKLILLDEPTAHLDINYQIETLDLVKDLCQEHDLAAIAALHDLNLAAQYCDRLIMLNGGGIHAEGSPKQVITAQHIKAVYGAEVCVYPHPFNALPATLIIPGDGRSPSFKKGDCRPFLLSSNS